VPTCTTFIALRVSDRQGRLQRLALGFVQGSAPNGRGIPRTRRSPGGLWRTQGKTRLGFRDWNLARTTFVS
jgi:hypothetical protein